MEGVRLWSECCLHYNHGFDYRAVALPHHTGFHVCKLPRLKPKAVGHHEKLRRRTRTPTLTTTSRKRLSPVSAAAQQQPLELTEDNIRQVLADARVEFGQLFDDSVGITGQAELAELDGPFVKISLKGRFWHERSTVLARLGNYMKQRIPDILEVDIEDEKQLDDSPENF